MFLLYIYGNIIKYRCVRYIYIKINLKQGRAGGVLNSRAGLVFLKVLVNKFIYIFYKAPRAGFAAPASGLGLANFLK